MGQSSSRQSHSVAEPNSNSTPEAVTPQPTPRRRSVRKSLLNLVKPSKSWRNSRRFSKAAEESEQPASSSSSSSATLEDDSPDDDEQEHDQNQNQPGPSSSSPEAMTNDPPSPPTPPPIIETPDVPLLPIPVAVATSSSSAAAAPTDAPPPPPPHAFPPPGTLVVVQGVVHTTDVPRPTPTRPNSTPPTPSARNRLSTFLNPGSRPPSRSSFHPSSTTLDTAPPPDDPPPQDPPQAPPAPESDSGLGPISSGSIDVLGTLLSVAAAATAASLLTGTSDPLALPASLGPPTPSPLSPTTSPTPTLSHAAPIDPPAPVPQPDATRLRHAWSGIRERLGLRPHPSSTPSSSTSPLVSSSAPPASPALDEQHPLTPDAREHLFGQMARAFNLGLGLATDSVGSTSTGTGFGAHTAQGTAEGAPAPAAEEDPAEGSFERFLLDLQADLRVALTTPSPTPAPTEAPTPPPPAPITTPPSAPTPAAPPAADDADSLYTDMPPLGDVSDSDSDSDADSTFSRVDSFVLPSSPQAPATTPAAPEVDAQGRINWWRLYRFAPISIPPPTLPSASSPSPTTTSPAPSTDQAPADPTLAELPFASSSLPLSSSAPDAPTSVVPVIVVGVQSVLALPPPSAPTSPTSPSGPSSTNTNTDPAQDDPLALGDDSDTPNDSRAPTPAPWTARAADAIRSLRPRRARAAAQPTAGSRTFLIYVIGGYYPPEHSILNGGPDTLASLEALLELADLLGHTKPATVTRADIARSGLETIKASLLPQYEAEEKISANCTERCLICLDDYEPEDDIRVMKCRHAFHQNCVDKWLETGRNNCPACRSKGVSTDGEADA